MATSKAPKPKLIRKTLNNKNELNLILYGSLVNRQSSLVHPGLRASQYRLGAASLRLARGLCVSSRKQVQFQ